MLPGKKFTPALLAGILWRRKWLLVLPLLVASAGAVIVAKRLPNRYKSETVILVIPQRVPESYVRSTVTTRIEDRLRTIRQQALSRPRLEQLIKELDLYAGARRIQSLDEVVAQMRDDVAIDLVQNDSFKITYTYTHPLSTMKVTERLATMFIEDNLRDRESQAEGTSQFLEAQLDDARRRLTEQERRLEEYRRLHSGELPSQLQSNLQVVQNSQTQLQTLSESMLRDRDRQTVLDRSIADLGVTELGSAPTTPIDNGAATQLPTQRQLDLARQTLQSLEMRFTPEHPDVVRARRQVAELADKVRRENAANAAQAPVADPTNPADVARLNRLAALRAERDSLGRQIAIKAQEQERLKQLGAKYQARVEVVPTRESELTELTRDYDTLLTSYKTLLAKKEESQIATNLERRQIGEQFRVVDPARVPERPISPNRPVIAASGVVIGLLLGLGAIAILELLDRSVRSENDVLTALGLPVLAMVPLVMSAEEVVSRRRRKLLTIAATAIVGVLMSVGVVLWRLS